MGCCSPPTIFFLGSNLGTASRLVLKPYRSGKVKGKQQLRRSLEIKAEVEFVNANEAKKLVAVDGYVVLDVCDKTQFERSHIKECHHVPLFIENKENDLGTVIKRTMHNNFSGLFFGLPFTKPNPEFLHSVRSQFSHESKLLLVCQEGLRSAAAAQRLEEAGYQKIAFITSGLKSVKPGTFDYVGSTELQNAGKAGLVTVQGKISAVLGTVLILLHVDLFTIDIAARPSPCFIDSSFTVTVIAARRVFPCMQSD